MLKKDDSKPKQQALYAVVHLFVWSMVAGVVVSFLHSDNSAVDMENTRPFPVPDQTHGKTWSELDSLVPNDILRLMPPWNMRVNDAMKKRYGNMKLMKSHSTICRR